MIRLPTEEETAYMTEHMNDSRVRDIIACTVTCGVAAFGILALRLYARLRSAGFLVLNDWLCIATWVSSRYSSSRQPLRCSERARPPLGVLDS